MGNDLLKASSGAHKYGGGQWRANDVRVTHPVGKLLLELLDLLLSCIDHLNCTAYVCRIYPEERGHAIFFIWWSSKNLGYGLLPLSLRAPQPST